MMREWYVYKDETNEFGTARTLYDIVYFDDHLMAPDVYNDLVGHDGYSPDIILVWKIRYENSNQTIQIEYPSELYQPGDEYNKISITVNENIPDEVIMEYIAL